MNISLSLLQIVIEFSKIFGIRQGECTFLVKLFHLGKIRLKLGAFGLSAATFESYVDRGRSYALFCPFFCPQLINSGKVYAEFLPPDLPIASLFPHILNRTLRRLRHIILHKPLEQRQLIFVASEQINVCFLLLVEQLRNQLFYLLFCLVKLFHRSLFSCNDQG